MATGGADLTARKFRTCRSCFYKWRLDPRRVTVLDRGRRCKRCYRYGGIQAVLREQIYETTFIRVRQSCREWPVKCDPRKVTCTGDECPYAHGEEELESWQKQFPKDYDSLQAGIGIVEHPVLVSNITNRNLEVGSTAWSNVEPEEDKFSASNPSSHSGLLVPHGRPDIVEKALGEVHSQKNKGHELTKESQSNARVRNHCDRNEQPKETASSQKNQDKLSEQIIAPQFPCRIGEALNKEELDVLLDPNTVIQQKSDHQVGISTDAMSGWVSEVTKFDFNSPLTRENYKRRFHHLLHLEEKEHIFQLQKRCNNKEYDIVFVNNENYGNEQFISYISTSSSNSDILSFAKQASKSCSIDIGGKILNVEHNNQIFKLPHFIKANFNAIVFHHTSEDRKSLGIDDSDREKRFKGIVTFIPEGTYFSRMHKAVNNISEDALRKIIPSETQFHRIKRSNRISFDKKHSLHLDEDQKSACAKVLATNSEIPFIILGPFGTGKTRVLAKMAHTIIGFGNRFVKPKILLVAHHQSSADTLAHLFVQLNDPSVRVVRICKANETSKREGCVLYLPINEVTGINSFDVVVTTLGTSYNLWFKIDKSYRIGFFTHILIDEGAQTREPEAIIPLCFVGKSTKIVIAGDHCQVGPRLHVLGDEAQTYGLAVSLLERLHNIYANNRPQSEAHTASLIMNYRCVPEIVRFSSHLYYESSLHCDLQSYEDEWRPIQFICSSIKDTDTSIANNIDEANIIISTVRNYIVHQPEDSVGIICPSSTQALLLRELVRKSNLVGVEVLKTYDVQGREFEAVFISTCEEVADGSAINHTKSLSNHYVFNTVITRSKYLVVAIGNPYLLIGTEQNMMKKFPKSAKQCWTPFLRKCYDSEQLKLSDVLPDGEIEENYKSFARSLSTSLFRESLNFSKDVEANDSILDAYTKAYEHDNKFTEISKYYSKQNHRVYNSIDVGGIEYKDVLDCKLEATTFYDANAIPLDSKKSEVLIQGRRNRIGAFNGDIVTVGVFPSSIPETRYGRVIKVVERVKNVTFVCEVSPDNSDNFFPIDAKNPIFKNFPNNTNNFYRKDKQMQRSNKHGPIFVYSFSTMTKNKPPKIEDMIEYKRALNMAFVIKFVSWNPKYSTPFGVVIKAFYKAHNSITAECLLRIVHSISLESDSTQSATSLLLHDHSHDDHEGTVDYPCAFTIDPDNARNLDDAITLCKVSESVYKLGIHITDISEGVLPDSEEDRVAFNKGTAVYYKSCDEHKMIPMLSNDTLENFSLLPGKVRNVWSTTCDVHFNSDGDVTKIDTVDIQQSRIRSVLQLTYEEAQSILSGTQSPELSNDYNSLNSISLKKTLDILYSVALHFSKIRMRYCDAMYWYGEGTGDMSDWQAHKLVEELMIWTNSEVAKKLRSRYPEGALMRCQPMPDNRVMEKYGESISEVAQMSFNLSRYNHKSTSLRSLLIPKEVFNALKSQKSKANVIEVAGIIMSDSLFPQRFVASKKKKIISQRSKYCIREPDVPERSYCHFSLGLDAYIHFTSPLRRYIDIVVQRLLKGGFQNQAAINDKFCCSMNSSLSQASDFEKDMKRVDLALSVQYCSRLCHACIETNAKATITIGILCNKLASLSSKYTKIRTSNLGPFMPTKSPQHYSWNIRITSLSGGKICGATISQLDSHHKLRSTSYLQMYETDDQRLRIRYYGVHFPSGCIPVSPQQWKNALEFTKNPNLETLSLMDFIDVTSYHTPTGSDLKEIRIGTAQSPFINYIFSLPLGEGEYFRIWLSMRMRRCFPEPIIQIVELSPLCRVCVQHNTNPAECFSGNILKQASRQRYQSIKEYINLWQRVLVAEAAVASVFDSEMLMLRDARLTWPEFTLTLSTIYDSCTYVVRESVTLTLPKQFMDNMSEYLTIKVGDLICARYGYSDESALKRVFHFVVKATRQVKDIGDCIIQMELNQQENTFSEEMQFQLRNSSQMYELQVIKMCRSYRRVYEALLRLDSSNKRNCLVQKIAIHPRQLQDMRAKSSATYKILQKDRLALDLWEKMTTIQLNQRQRDSIEMAMEYKLQLIRGPPGTGKSVTGAHIAYIFAMSNRTLQQKSTGRQMGQFVLYCGPSNKSVDVVFEKFFKFYNDYSHKKIKILRIYGRAIENKDYPTLPDSISNETSNYNSPEWGKDFILHHMIRDKLSTDASIKQFIAVEKKFKKICENSLPNAETYTQFRKAQAKAESSVLNRGYDIVFCTCNEVCGIRLKEVGMASHCIIDEAGMATEPETLLPISHCDHVVLIGDHSQLQPVIVHRPSSENGLSTSLFQRYATHYEEYMYGLNIQYRMHAEICKFPSKKFYEGKLKTDKSVLSRRNKEAHLKGFWPAGPQCPIVFCDVIGEETQEETGTIDGRRVGIVSKHNLIEAKKAVEVVQVLCGEKFRIDYGEVAILTPYRAQKVVIQKELEKRNLDNIKVATISDSQGDEYGFVILSVVRSKPKEYIEHPEYICADKYWLEQNLGFVTDKHQINVGITRSKYGLVIIGNKLLLSYNSTWKDLFDHYEQKRCVVDGYIFPPHS